MQKKICGYCPTQGKNYSITVSYIDASTNEGKAYIRGRGTCDYTKAGNQCNLSKCPLIDLAPENL